MLKPKRKSPSMIFEKIEKEVEEGGVKIIGQDFENGEIFIKENSIAIKFNGVNLKKFNCVYFRMVRENKNFAFIISRLAKKYRIKYFDKLYEQTAGSTKLIQTFLLAEKGISVPRTYYSPEYSAKKISTAIKFLKFPIVIKKCNTSQGRGVFLAKNKKDLIQKLSKIKGKEAILQEYIENDFDYRILVLGSRVAVAEKKIRTSKTDFRSNIRLGAEEKFLPLLEVSEKIKNIAREAARTTNVQIAGVDVVMDKKGKLFIFEVNSTPVFTLDEEISNEIPEVVKYLIKCGKRK